MSSTGRQFASTSLNRWGFALTALFMTSTRTTKTTDHTCPTCGKSYKSANGLRTHGRTHRDAAPVPTVAPEAPATPPGRATAAPTDGTMACTGPCGETKPITKFPTYSTKDGSVARRTVCRACRDAARKPRGTTAA